MTEDASEDSRPMTLASVEAEVWWWSTISRVPPPLIAIGGFAFGIGFWVSMGPVMGLLAVMVFAVLGAQNRYLIVTANLDNKLTLRFLADARSLLTPPPCSSAGEACGEWCCGEAWL